MTIALPAFRESHCSALQDAGVLTNVCLKTLVKGVSSLSYPGRLYIGFMLSAYSGVLLFSSILEFLTSQLPSVKALFGCNRTIRAISSQHEQIH